MKKSKQVLSVLLAVLMLALSVPFAAADDVVEIGGQCGENVFWKLDDQGKLTIFGEGEMEGGGFWSETDCEEKIITVDIQEGVTSICDRAFINCRYMTQISIPDSVTSIGDSAFYACYSLNSITIPKSVLQIKGRAFNECSLHFITVEANNPNYMNDSFGVLYDKDQTKLIACPRGFESETYTIPNTVKEIEMAAFAGVERLRSIVIPGGVETIGGGAFGGCYRLQSISLSEGLERIGDDAFSRCGFSLVTIPSSVTSIGKNAFAYCQNLTSISVDENNSAFSSDSVGVLFNKDKTELILYPCARTAESYTIPNSVKTVCSYGFAFCFNLRTVAFPGGLEELQNDAFYTCDNLDNVVLPYGIKTLPNYVFGECSSLKSVSIPNSVERIDYAAFWNDYNLETIEIPSSVREIEREAFGGCSRLVCFSVDENNPAYSTDENGLLFNKDKTEFVLFPYGKDWQEYSVPETVKTIEVAAFSSCKLERILLPEGLETIEWIAFSGCSNLKEIKIPEGVSSLESYTFSGCQKLEKVYLPFSLSYIGYEIFYNCEGLTDVYFAGSELEWKDIETWNNKQFKIGNASVHFSDCTHANYLAVPAIESTSCTELGYTEGKRCADCGRWIVKQKKMITPHLDENKDGLCDRCGQLVSEIELGETYEVTLRGQEKEYFRFIPVVDGKYSIEFIINDTHDPDYGFEDELFNQDKESLGWSERTLNAGEVYYFGISDSYNMSENAQSCVSFRLKKTLGRNGDCGKYMSWNYYSRELDIRGIGDMWNYAEEAAPWGRQSTIQAVSFRGSDMSEGEIRSINADAFSGMINIHEIYNYCDNLVVADTFERIANNFIVYCNENSAEHQYCEENGIPYRLFGSTTEKEVLTDDETDVSISYYADAFDTDDVALQVETLDTQNENARAWSIAPVDTEGNKVQPNQPVQIRLPLPAGWKQKSLLITHTHDDGEIEMIANYTVDGDYVTFWVSRFSTFTVAVQEEEPPHEHTYNDGVVTTPATCTAPGVMTYTCVDGDDSYTEEISALGHVDDDNNGLCDRCEQQMEGGDHCPQCGKIHNGGFFDKLTGFFHKIIYRLTHLFQR